MAATLKSKKLNKMNLGAVYYYGMRYKYMRMKVEYKRLQNVIISRVTIKKINTKCFTTHFTNF